MTEIDQPDLPPHRPNRRVVPKAIVLSSHPASASGVGVGTAPAIAWGAGDAKARGPVVATMNTAVGRNTIGTHAGAYSLYRELAIAAGQLDPYHRADLTQTSPAATIGPFAQWLDPDKIVSLDPWGHMTSEVYAAEIAAGADIRPSIAVTRAHINMPEVVAAM